MLSLDWLLLEAVILTCSWWGQDAATGAAWEEKGGLWGRRAFCSPLHRPSLSLQFTAHVLTDPLGSFSSPCLWAWLFLRGTAIANTAPTHRHVPPTDPCCRIPPCCSLQEVLCCTNRLFPFGPGKFPFLFMHYFTYASAFFHSLVAWSVVRRRHSRASFNLKQHWVCINTAVKPFRPLAFAQNSSLHM